MRANEGTEHPSGDRAAPTRDLEIVRLPAPPRFVGVPRVSQSHIRRDRLHVLLDQADGIPLRVIQGGTGFGKTSLLAEWVRTRDSSAPKTLWVTADEGVRDSLSFWPAVIRMLDRFGLVETTEFRSLEPRGDLTATLVSTLCRAFDSLPAPVTIVIDGFERLVRTSVEQELIDVLARTDNLHVVIATHMGSVITDVTTAAKIDTLLIDAPALRFDADEVELLARRMNIHASADELHELTRTLDGWPFGIRAVLERRKRDEATADVEEHYESVFGPSAALPQPLDLGFAYRYLLESLRSLEGLELLIVTSVVDAFTLEQASVLGSDLRDSPVLADIESRGLGVWEDDTDPPRFRFHPVFRSALKKELERNPSDATAAYLRLAEWFAENEDFARAFESAVFGGAWKLASKFMRRSIFTVLERLTVPLIEQIPRAALRNDPLLMMLTGIAYYGRGRHAKAIQVLISAVALSERQQLTQSGAPGPEQVWMQAVLTASLRLIGRYELVPAALRRFNRMLNAVRDPDGTLDVSRTLFRTQATSTLLLLDQLDQAEQMSNAALDDASADTTFLQRTHRLALAAFAHARRGDLTSAAKKIATIGEAGQPKQFEQSYYAIPLHFAAASAALDRFDPRTAAGHLEQTDPHWPTMEFWPFALELRTMIDWQRGSAETALLTLHEGRAEKKSRPSIGPAMNASLTALEAELLLATGRISDATALLPSSRVRKLNRLTVPKARLLLHTGQNDQAANLADEYAHRRSVPWSQRVQLLLISSSANLREGDVETAQHRFERAVEIAARTSLSWPFAAMPRADFLLLSQRHPDLAERVSACPELYPEPGHNISLSRREQVVLAAIASDSTLTEIAEDLSVSRNTLKSQLRAIYRKLGVSDRGAAATHARQRGLLRRSDDS